MRKFSAAFTVLALFASVAVCSISTLSAQGPSALPAPSDVITFAAGQAIRGHSTAGWFAPVTLNPLETAAIKLQFPPTFTSAPVIVQALDGGALGVSDQSARIAADGTTSFQFQVAAQPGVYRVLVIVNGTASMVQFLVPQQ